MSIVSFYSHSGNQGEILLQFVSRLLELSSWTMIGGLMTDYSQEMHY